MSKKNDGPRRTWTEEIEVAGSDLVGRIKALVSEGNVRHVKIKAALRRCSHIVIAEFHLM